MAEEFNNWDLLIAYIEDRKVIPVIGDQLLQVNHNGAQVPLYQFLAERLMQHLGLGYRCTTPTERLAINCLNDVVCEHIKAGGKTDDIYPYLSIILRKETDFEVPKALAQLAAIDHFDLFVSLSFDNFLADALNQIRFAGREQTLQLSYSPSGSDVPAGGGDLPDDWRQSGHPVVFQLFGQASIQPNYAVSDEDRLEFVHSLQNPDRRPKHLFDELSRSHLLFLGCRYSDWLVRFFIRTSKNLPLSARHFGSQLLVDSQMQAPDNQDLVLFLKYFGANIQTLPISATDFVGELSRRWHKEHPAVAESNNGLVRQISADEPADMKDGAVFISYASEDLQAALRLHQDLEAADFVTWLDKQGLEPGDHWDRKIQRHINNCALFVALISKNTEQRREGYFRKEWRWAAKRAESFAEGEAFILPVIIDDLRISDDLKLPEAFLAAQATKLTGGATTAEFETKIGRVLRAWSKSQRQKGAA
ncbi:toll/interleukin-1 receptor domain-containing protein [Methylomonas sp. MgM2]